MSLLSDAANVRFWRKADIRAALLIVGKTV
jgi:hypothetical protein